MLWRCLKAISDLELPAGVEAQTIVIDNEAEPNNKLIAEAAGVHYAHEPRRGIAQARNCAIEEALQLKPDFIAYIDDDQTPRRNWLTALLAVQAEHGADAVQPRLIAVFPEDVPFWALRPGREPREPQFKGHEWANRKSAATGGTMFSARLVHADGLNLRFNANLALAGGEDVDFFGRAYQRGAKIIWSARPVLTEEAHSSRMTYRRYASRGLAMGGHIFVADRDKRGFCRALFKHGKGVLVRSFRGVGQLAIAPLFAPFSLRRFKFTALEGGRNLCVAAGIVGGFFSLQYEYYRQIDGR
jgi:glycosyltransferase involved in cell wall biosynthesis